MRCIIAGSRSIRNTLSVRKAIEASKFTVTEIISGHAEGVDTIGEEIAKEDGIDLTIFPANWKKYSKAAGYKRNSKMAWYATLFQEQSDDKLKGALIAVWNGTSKGTKHMIDIAREWGMPVYIHTVEEEEALPQNPADWNTSQTEVEQPF